ncbi:MAG: hypothetical protein KAI47_08930 [Deltaproteobacteria bacterium]|nr:hypothetical protein [Deltaproteobacteria bacterium]
MPKRRATLSPIPPHETPAQPKTLFRHFGRAARRPVSFFAAAPLVAATAIATLICAPIRAPAAPPASTFDYVTAINRANALKKAGQFERAIAIYVDTLAQEQAQCSASPRKDSLRQLPQDSPCWRMMKIQFNLAITRRDQGKSDLAAKAFASYLAQWHSLLPHERFYPWEERAHFEIAQSHFALKRWNLALSRYRKALSRWKEHHPKRRPRFADIALRRQAECLEHLDRRAEAASTYEAFLRVYARVHGSPHADATYVRKRIAALRSHTHDTLTTPPPDDAIQDAAVAPQRSTAWLVAAITSTVFALAGEGLGVGFTLWAKDTYTDLPEFATRRNVAIAGHVIGGVAAIGAAISYYLYFRSGQERTKPTHHVTRLQILAGPTQAAIRWRF